MSRHLLFISRKMPHTTICKRSFLSFNLCDGLIHFPTNEVEQKSFRSVLKTKFVEITSIKCAEMI